MAGWPSTEMSKYIIHQGDCLDHLEFIADNSVDSIVTDPPYGLAFMGKKWDYDVPSEVIWRECLRVLKPGGHLLAFFGTRTYHRGVVPIEDAGFEVRDQIGWAYGSGFPKSHNGEWGGTALKPAWEPICVARKPLIGTIEANWREHGTGALNVDACRVNSGASPSAAYRARGKAPSSCKPGEYGDGHAIQNRITPERWLQARPGEELGRWPANLIHDGSDEVLAAFPQAAGQQGPVSATAPSDKTSNVYGRMKREGEASADSDNEGAVGFKMKPGMRRLDSGSAARFFYCAKASKRDRDDGLHLLENRILARSCQAQAEAKRGNVVAEEGGAFNKARIRKNNHPTVKPTDLMRHLCRLVTPAGGVVLDPFMGSGSTGKAALLEGFRFIGIEREVEYVEIARARIAAVDDDEL